MEVRLRAVKGLAVLLYIGPLFAGLGGLGPVVIAPFVAIFVGWLIVLRPEQWPLHKHEWTTKAAWAAALSQILSQTLLVCVLLAVGRGAGFVAGIPPIISPLLPLAISFVAIPLCRLLWDSREAAGLGVFLDAESKAAHAPRALTLAGAAVVPLLNLGEGVSEREANEAVAEVLAHEGASLRFKALVAALSQTGQSHTALRRALIITATEPETVASGRIPHAMAGAFEIAGKNPDLLRLYLPRALALLSAFANRADGFPAADQVRLAAAGNIGSDPQGELHDGLLTLATAIETTRARRAGASLGA
jgi:hypothetical protein